MALVLRSSVKQLSDNAALRTYKAKAEMLTGTGLMQRLVSRLLIQTYLGATVKWDFQDGTSWASISTKSNFLTSTKWAYFGNFNREAKDLIFCSTKLFFLELVLSWKG